MCCKEFDTFNTNTESFGITDAPLSIIFVLLVMLHRGTNISQQTGIQVKIAGFSKSKNSPKQLQFRNIPILVPSESPIFSVFFIIFFYKPFKKLNKHSRYLQLLSFSWKFKACPKLPKSMIVILKECF